MTQSAPHLPRLGKEHQKIDTKTVGCALYDQAPTKTPRPDHINFQALRLLGD